MGIRASAVGLARATSRTLPSVLATLSLTHAARAEGPSVRVNATCTIAGTSSAAMLEILRAELSPADVSVPNGSPVLDDADDIAVVIDACDRFAPAARSVVYRGGERREKWVDLTGVAIDDRDRALALALAESIQRIEREQPAQASVPSPAVTTPMPTTAPTPGSGASPPESPQASGGDEHGAPSAAPSGVPHSDRPLSLRFAPLFRYTERTGTPFFGADATFGWNPLGFGVRGLVAHDDTPIGSTLQTAIAGIFAAEWFALGPSAGFRGEIEFGAAIATGTPNEGAVGYTRTSPHWGVTTSLLLLSPLTDEWAMDAALGGGYGSSLTIQVDDRDSGTLGGWYLNVALGARWSPADSLPSKNFAARDDLQAW
jgi:hypothetical protein